ncbi:DUF2933 domain-containing protein [Streptomyces minutiscleroticus]|uniref:DUF2933 domain-containing protein n=1 Tax=Streptomyces minutiscleroticus TaxID=68238 RepID=A0A918P346_9ACTN|nr:DUF2933 domain-containing protein [Streptomyces minutiscleroticus]GGY17266.1 hypothetical protein GCM10010358_80950 [Streptomyces minutiscleroticus]
MNNKRNYGMYALAAAIVIATVLVVGAPLQNLIWPALVVACPLMMFLMMRGMHGHGTPGAHDAPPTHRQKDPPHQHEHPFGPGRQ